MNLDVYHSILRRLGVQPAVSDAEQAEPAAGTPGARPDAPEAPLPRVRAGAYAWPWPNTLPGLGCRTVGPFAPCAGCEHWSWVRYGDRALCLVCANRLNREARA